MKPDSGPDLVQVLTFGVVPVGGALLLLGAGRRRAARPRRLLLLLWLGLELGDDDGDVVDGDAVIRGRLAVHVLQAGAAGKRKRGGRTNGRLDQV